MRCSPHLLLLTDDDATRRRWVAALAELPARLFQNAAELDLSAVVDVIVVDRPLASGELTALLPERAEELAHGEIAVLLAAMPPSVDPATLADYALPVDYTDRELRLACGLLGEIAALRRRHQRGDRLRKALTQLALSDPLTGLANRRAWEEELRSRVEDAIVSGRPLALAMLDLDNFKPVNDRFGYSSGDEVLRAAARALAANVRSGDFVARYGGDEFAVLIADAPPDAARAGIERLRAAVVAALSQLEYGPLSASVGLANFQPGGGMNASHLFQAANHALRMAKTGGRNRVAVAEIG